MNLSLACALGRRALAASAALGTALLLVTCTGEPVAPGGPRLGQVTIAPIWPEASRLGGLVLDSVHLTVVRVPSDTLARVGRRFAPATTQLQLTVPVLLLGPSENLQVTLDLLSGPTLLFRGTQLISVTAGGGGSPIPIPVTFACSTCPVVASLTLQPRDTTISAGGTFAFSVTAQDSQAAPVAQFYTTWSSSSAAVTIDGAGVVTAGAGRATVMITAVTPSGARDSTTLTVVPPATQLVIISGDNQSAGLLSPLPLPLVVEVRAADNLPVAGATVTFAVLSGGGSVDSATATTNLAGRATSGATLGATVGAQSFTASASGTNSVTFDATATSGGVKVWTGAVDRDWNTAANWSPAALPTAGDSVAVPLAANRPILTGNATIRVLTMQAGVGSNNAIVVTGNLTVSGNVALPDTNSFITFTSGQFSAGSVTLAGFQAFIDVSAGSASVTGPILITGNRAFFEAGPGSALGVVTLSGNQAFLSHYGGTQGPVTASGTSAFWEAGGAVTVTGTPAIQLTGTAYLTSFGTPVAVTINGDVTVGGTAAFFNPSGGDHWTINGNLQTTGGGVLTMTQVTDTVEVNGNVSFGGGDESTQLSAGQLFVSGNFSQTGLATSFVGSGTHLVFLDGSGSQTLNFASPGFAASRFQNVIVANSAGGVTATSDIFASGTAGVTPTAVRTLSGNGSTLFTTILNVSNFTFNNLLLNFTGSTVVTFDTVTFQGYAPTATPLTIVHPGAAAPLPFQDIVFTVTPTSGFYIDATDSNPTDGVPLVIDMLNPTPASPGTRVQTAGGATVNWTSTGPILWTGNIDNDWFKPANWSSGAVPTTLDDVVIPAGRPNDPAINGSAANARDLTVQSGAVLVINLVGLNLSGSLDVVGAGIIIGTTTSVNLTGTGTVRGNLSGTVFTTLVNGSYTLNGRLVTPGLTINGSLTLAGNTAEVGSIAGDDFQTSNFGVLVMTNALDSLIVGGTGPSLTFDGGSTVGKLTAGVILMNSSGIASFTQGNTFSGSSFTPTGSHKVVLAGAGSINLTTATGHFNILDISAQTAGISLSSQIQVDGLFISAPSSGSPAITGGSRSFIAAGGTQVTGLTLTNTQFVVNGGSSIQFDNVTFQGLPTAAHQLTVSLPGFATPLVFNNLVFLPVPTTGFYLNATDTDGPSPDTLIVNLVNPNPATDGGHTVAGNGAVINWPAVVPIIWTGAVSADWNTAGNWSPARIPTSTDDVIIPLVARQPTLSGNGATRDLTVQPSVVLNLASFQIVVNGNLDATGSGVTGAAGSRIVMNGTNGSMRGVVGVDLTIGGNTSLSASFALTGSLLVLARLNLNGSDLQLSGDLSTLGSSALIVMQNPADILTVAGNATFDGGNQLGFMTTGRLDIGGNFIQAASNSLDAFHSSGSHLTVFTGASPTLTFFTPGNVPGTSHFEQVRWTGTGTMTLASNVFAHGTMDGAPGVSGTISSINHTLQVGNFVSGGATFNGTSLVIDQPLGAPIVLDNTTFINMSSTVNQLTVNHPGTGGPFTFSNLTFSSTPTTGFYLVANDLDGAAANGPLTINMVSPSPTAPSPSLFNGTNGAVINWPTVSPVITWTGGAGTTDWNTATNWSTGAVPTASDSVVIVASTTTPVLIAPTSVGAVNVSSGTLTLGGQTLTVARTLTTTGTGTLTMTNALDSVEVNGAAIFAGGSTAGLLTAGVLNVKGDLTQLSGTSNRSYAPSGTHRTRLTGTAPQTVDFAFTGSTGSEPNALTIDNSSAGGVTFTDVHLIPGGVTLNGSSILNALATFNVSGSFTAGPGTTVNAPDLGIIGGPIAIAGIFNADTLTGVNLNPIPVLPYKTLRMAQGANVLAPGATYTITGSLLLNFTGSLRLNGSSVSVAGDLIVASSGQLIMDDPGDTLDLAGNATFDGGDETGLLTAGLLRVAGNFTQLGSTSKSSFAASGTHQVQFIGSVPVSISMADTSLSHFQNLSVNNSAARINLPGLVQVLGNLDLADGSQTTSSDQTLSGGGFNVLGNVTAFGAGSVLSIGRLYVGGALSIGGTYDVTSIIFTGTGQTAPSALPYQYLYINGTVTMAPGVVAIDSQLTVSAGSLTLAGRTTLASGGLFVSGGTLDLGGHTLVVAGSANTTGSGTMTMTNPLDSVLVSGASIFGGGDETGKLTAGVLILSGDLASNGPGLGPFRPSGTHKTVLNGTVEQVLSNSDPTAVALVAQELDISAALGGVRMAAPLVAAGSFGVLTSLPTGPAPVLRGTAGQEFAGNGVNVNGLVVDGATFFIGDPTFALITQFDNVTFQNQSPAETQLGVSHPGAATPFTFSNLVFSVVPTTGFYISATDNIADANTLTIDMVNASPANPAGLIFQAGGAVINWPPVAPVITWTGSVSTDWSVAGNWSPAQVPTSANDVVIPSTTLKPQVTGGCTAKSILVNSGGQLDLGGFNCQVFGNVVVSGTTAGTGAFQFLAAGQVQGNLRGLIVMAPVSLSNTAAIIGDLTISGAGASFDVNGFSAAVTGNLITQTAGRLIMNNPADDLNISGSALFDGGNESGLLTAGTLTVAGNFTQAATSSAASFFASGTHRSAIGAGAAVAFATPGNSRFQDLDLRAAGSAMFTLGSNVTAAGTLLAGFNVAAPAVITGSGFTLTAGGASIAAISGQALLFDGVALVLSGGTIGSFNDVAFDNQNPSGTAFTVNNVGGGAPFTFNRVLFSTVLSAGGLHLVANDLDGPTTNGPLTINMTSAAPTSGAGVSQANNGAVINWPPAGNAFTWNGAADNNWSNPANWDRNAVPGVIDDVVLVPITSQPVLTTNVGINNLTSTAGSILDLSGFVLAVGGFADLAGTITDGVGGGGVTLAGSGGQLLQGTMNTTVLIAGSYLMNGNLTVGGDLAVNGTLDLGGFTATVSGIFSTINSGVVVMNNPTSFLDVTGDALFGGGNTNGLLTAGTLRIAGAFDQLGTNSAQSFAASPGHLTELSADPASITFTTPGITNSHFGDLRGSIFSVQMQLNSDATILGFLDSGDGFGGSFLGNSCPVTLTVTQWNSSATLDCVQLVIDEPAGVGTGMSDVTFLNLPTDVTQLTIRHPGTAAGNFSAGTINVVPLSGGDTGHYIDAVDLDGNPPFLVVDIFNSNVLNGPSFTTTSGGASVFWQNGTVTWTAAGGDNNWFNGANWDQLNVPGSFDSVVIPVTAIQPSLTGNVFVGAVNISGGNLTLNGNSLNVTRTFATTGTGTFTMNSAFSLLSVGGDALFAGGSTDGLLTAGQISIGGNFTQNAVTSVTSFAPSGSNLTSFSSAAPVIVDFGSPGAGSGGSHFMNLDLSAAAGGVTLTVNTIVDNALTNSTLGVTLHGGGSSLTARIWNVSGLTVDNAPMILDENGIQSTHTFDNVTFQGFPTTANSVALIDVTADGTAAGGRFIDFTNSQLQTSLGTGGLYLRAASGNGLGYLLRMIGSNDPTGGFSRSQATAPASIQYQ